MPFQYSEKICLLKFDQKGKCCKQRLITDSRVARCKLFDVSHFLKGLIEGRLASLIVVIRGSYKEVLRHDSQTEEIEDHRYKNMFS